MTPPATPSPARLAQLLEPNPQSNNVSRDLNAVLTNELPAAVVGTSSSSSASEGLSRPRSHSISYAEGISQCTNNPFDIDWLLWTANMPEVEQHTQKKKNTNPFIPSSPNTPEKIGEPGI